MQQQKIQQKTNRSIFFQYCRYRRMHAEDLTKEYLSILGLLYGSFISEGSRRIKDYSMMTMQEAQHELELRTILTKARVVHERQQLRDEHTQNEEAFFAELKAAS